MSGGNAPLLVVAGVAAVIVGCYVLLSVAIALSPPLQDAVDTRLSPCED